MQNINGNVYYSMRDIGKILNHDRDWVEVRINSFNLPCDILNIKGKDCKLYTQDTIEFLKNSKYIKNKKTKGYACKRNENSISITEIAKRTNHSTGWVKFRINYLKIQPNGTWFGHPSYSPSIINDLFSIDRNFTSELQHKLHSKESLKKQADSYKKYFWENRDDVVAKRKITRELKIKDYKINNLLLIDIIEKHNWYRNTVIKICKDNDIKLITKFAYLWVKKSDYFKLKELMKKFENTPYCSSYREIEIKNFIKSIYNGNIIENNRQIIKPKELDIYIPSKKVAIEFDGLFWHSTFQRDDLDAKTLHYNKTIECEKLGIRLIHIFEDEWINKQEICKSIIASALGIYKRKIFARKCEIKEVPLIIANDFLNNNHLQGSVNGKSLGLYYNDELVQIITYGKSRFVKDELELYRMCTLLNTQVIGGFSKLMKHLNSKIISYIDRRLFNGNGYLKSNWKIISYSKPSYYYTKGNKRENRMKYQKHKLKNILKIYDETENEEMNMRNNGYYRIYDCGTIKVEYKV